MIKNLNKSIKNWRKQLTDFNLLNEIKNHQSIKLNEKTKKLITLTIFDDQMTIFFINIIKFKIINKENS